MNLSHFSVFRNVVLALFIRELKTRFGDSKMGPFWIIVEPLMHMVVMMLMFSVLMGRMMPEVPFSLFLVTGMIPFFMFRNIVTSVMNSIPANIALFSYRPVRPIAVYVARTILEMVIYVTVFLSIIIFMVWFGIEDVAIGNPLELLAVTGMLIALGLGMGIVLSVVTHKYPSLKALIGIFMMLLYFMSGVMFPVWVLPSEFIPYLMYNPVLHLIELFRESFFSYYPKMEEVSIELPFIYILVFGYLGLWFYEKRERYLKSST